MANVSFAPCPANVTFNASNATLAVDDCSGELSFVSSVLVTHCGCENTPFVLKRVGTHCSPYSMLGYAMLAFAAYLFLPVVMDGISVIKDAVLARCAPDCGLDAPR